MAKKDLLIKEIFAYKEAIFVSLSVEGDKNEYNIVASLANVPSHLKILIRELLSYKHHFFH